jgi:sugar lactone lactonase YvrE
VADRDNNRIQLFQLGQLNGITVAGSGSSPATITLNGPIGIVLDAAKYLFIVDHFNDRIVGSGPTGFRCVVGCSGLKGSASNQLVGPWSLSFDSYGNMFVTDQSNHRIQKFILSRYTCSKF